jgi:hypothetical protein
VREHPGSFVAGVLFIVIGAAFLGEGFGWWTVAVGRLWPLVLIAIGAVVILNAAQDRTDEEE